MFTPTVTGQTAPLESQAIRSEVTFLNLDADKKSLLFMDILESVTPSEKTGALFGVTKGVLRKMAMDDPAKVETLSPTLQLEGGPIQAVLWSPARDQAILYTRKREQGYQYYLFDRGSQSIVPCPALEYLGWWGKKALFWCQGEPGTKRLVTNDSPQWQPQEIASITATLAARTSNGISFIFGDRLMIEYRMWNGEVFWPSIDLRSGAIEQHSDIPSIPLVGFPGSPPSLLDGPDDRTLLLQADNPPNTQTATEYHLGIWRWQESQAPIQVYQGSLRFTSIAWLDANDFLFLRNGGRSIAQSSPELFTELWHGVLQGDHLAFQQIGEVPKQLGYLDDPVIGSNRSQLWCLDSSYHLVRIDLPDIPLHASPSPSWWIALVAGLVLLVAVFWFLIRRRRRASLSPQHPEEK